MKVTWDKFTSQHDDATSSFESLCSIIFSDIAGVKVQRVPKNYPGLEARPVKDTAGKTCSYQSKFFRGEDANSQYAQIKHSLNAISDSDLSSLNIVYIFVNSTAAGVETKCEDFWKKYLVGKKIKHIKLEWRYGIDFFLNHLSDEKFEGIMSMFFGQGRPIKLHDSNYTESFLEVRQKPFYIDLPIEHNAKKVTVQKIVNEKSPYVLIQSRAGTGKSWLINELAYRIAGSGLNFKQQQLRIYEKGIVVHVTAYECIKTSVLDALSARLASYGIKPFDYKVTLLVDAIDEIEQELVSQLADGLSRLLRSGHIKQAIITSRIASINSGIASTILKPRVYEIPELDNGYILDYFVRRGGGRKVALLKKAVKEKVDLSAIRNVRMLEVAWSIATTTKDFSLENMFERRLMSQIDKLRPKSINLLEPLETSVESILQQQAFELQKNEVFDFSLNQIQDVVLNKFPRVNYSDTNSIIKFLEALCFDTTDINSGRLQFEHRSWVDYFTARYLTAKFDNDKQSLVDFATYEDFLVKWFVPVARKKYLSEGKVVPAIVLGFVEWYVKEDWVSWVDAESELMCDISMAEYNPTLVENVSSAVKRSRMLNIIRKAYDTGMTTQAAYAYEKVRTRLEAKRLFEKETWEGLVDYYYLSMKIKKLTPSDALINLQEVVKLNIGKKETNVRRNSDEYAGKLLSLSKEVIASGLSTEKVLSLVDPELYSYFFDFLILPDTIYVLRKDEGLKHKILKSLEDEGEKEQNIFLSGLVDNQWTDEIKTKAEKMLDELNSKQHTRDMHPLSYFTQRLSLLRILSHWNYDKLDNYVDAEHLQYAVITPYEVFHNLYGLIAVGDYDNENLSRFISWAEAAKHHVYSSRGNEANSIRRATSDVLGLLIKGVPLGTSSQLLQSLRTESDVLYSKYSLMLDVFNYDRKVFRKLFNYSDVISVIDESRDDVSDQQTVLRNFSSIIGMYSQQDLLSYISSTKKDSRLKYGYRKDTIGFFLIEALKVVIEDGIYGIDEIKNYTWRIYKIILRILEITDGKETHWLPDYLFEALRDYDMFFADEVYQAFEEDYPYDDYSVRTIIIVGAARRGDSYDSILQRMRKYRPSMLEPGRVTPAYYEEQLVCLSEVLNSPVYTSSNKEDALKRMSDLLDSLIKEAKNTRWSYKPDSFSDKLKTAANTYRNYKSKSPIKSELTPFPMATRQKDDGFSQSYKVEQRAEEKAARIALAKADSKMAILKIIKEYKNKGYGYLINDIAGSRLFVQKLEQASIPYGLTKYFLNRALDQHYYGRGSLNFAIAMWRSSYRTEMIDDLANSPHYSEAESILRLFREDGDSASIRQMIEHLTEFIEVLTRKEHQPQKNQSA